MAGKLASFVGTVQLKLKVEKATSSEDEPAPSAFFYFYYVESTQSRWLYTWLYYSSIVRLEADGLAACVAVYLLDEVVRAAGSNPKNISDVVEALKQRLEFRSSVIKQKALKLVKHAALKGSSELKRSLNKLSPLIRELTHYRCAPDPFKGDIPWKKVQEYARDALETIHAAPQYGQGHSSMSGEAQAARVRVSSDMFYIVIFSGATKSKFSISPYCDANTGTDPRFWKRWNVCGTWKSWEGCI
jgi:predicted transcriptional regulator with HTH domain